MKNKTITKVIRVDNETKKLMNDFYKDMKYIQASSSLPLLAKNVLIDNKEYLDGGISDSIPIKKAIELGYKKIIVILTQPSDYIKKPSKANKLIAKKYKNYQGLVTAMENRHNMYNDTIKFINEQEKLGNIFVIRPNQSLGIGRTEKNKDKLINAYHMGLEDACKNYNDLIKYLKEND